MKSIKRSGILRRAAVKGDKFQVNSRIDIWFVANLDRPGGSDGKRLSSMRRRPTLAANHHQNSAARIFVMRALGGVNFCGLMKDWAWPQPTATHSLQNSR